MNKDKSILDFVKNLEKEIDSSSYKVIDHVESDLFSVYIGNYIETDRLVFISTLNLEKGKYYYECELPEIDEDTKFPVVVSKKDNVDFNQIVNVIRRHLDIRD